jgi:uncharacterized protein YbjT (DUF2867 family)
MGKGHTLRLVGRHKDSLQRFENQPGIELHVGSAMDDDFMAGVLNGCDVAFLMMPADYQSPNIKIYQDELGLAQIMAIKKSGINRILFLSSWGAHTEENTGIVAGVARQEERLNLLDNVHVMHLRPTSFMENQLGNIGVIKSMGINGSANRADLAIPMIATQDIAQVAAGKLEAADWTGKTIVPLMGPRDYTMPEATKIIGHAIGKPDLAYVQFTYEQATQGMIQHGISESVAHSLVELAKGLNEGVFDIERKPEYTTPTTFEAFVSEVFVPVFNGQ